jgi:hypothetical protein
MTFSGIFLSAVVRLLQVLNQLRQMQESRKAIRVESILFLSLVPSSRLLFLQQASSGTSRADARPRWISPFFLRHKDKSELGKLLVNLFCSLVTWRTHWIGNRRWFRRQSSLISGATSACLDVHLSWQRTRQSSAFFSSY